MAVPLPPFPGNDIAYGVRLTDEMISWFNQLYIYITSTPQGGGGVVTSASMLNTTAPLSGGDKLVNNPTISITPSGITNTLLAVMPGFTMKGNPGSGLANPVDMTVTQILTMLGGITGFGNPTAKVGPAVVNGSALTAMRSDAAPAIDLSASYPWVGNHTFSPSSGVPISITSPSGSDAIDMTSTGDVKAVLSAISGHSASIALNGAVGGLTLQFDLNNNASLLNSANGNISFGTNNFSSIVISPSGTTISNFPISGTPLTVNGKTGQTTVISVGGSTAFYSQTNSTVGLLMSSSGNWGTVQNDSSNLWSLGFTTGPFSLGTPILQWSTNQILGRGPVANSMQDMTPDFTQATGTYTGCTTSPTVNIRYVRYGNIVVGSIDGPVLATSNATTFTVTGAVPVSMQPSHEQDIPIASITDNGTPQAGLLSFSPGSSTITVSLPNANFTALGNKGFGLSGTVFSYQLK